MPGSRTVLLDFDDTLSDPFLLLPQYVRRAGEILAPRFGGTQEGWARSMAALLEQLERQYVARFLGAPLSGYCVWLEQVREEAAQQMYARMNLPLPPNPARVALETQSAALRRCTALFPGAHEALIRLSAQGYVLHIASGQESAYLDAALEGAGLAALIDLRFGPDLIDCAKEGPEYYERIFDRLGCTSRDVVVVDDWPPALGWALQAGARVIQSKQSRERHFETVDGVNAVVTDLHALPDLIEQVFETPTQRAKQGANQG